MPVAEVKDGKIVEHNSTTSINSQAKGSKSTLDKDAFLGLLVAQMKYQDPLEPTSNTEFVAQYAQFSSLEQMQNMATTMELSRASSMVGKTVIVNTTNSSGMETQIEGRVDYVTYENGKAYVSIDGALYSLDDVYAIEDDLYIDTLELATNFVIAMNKLPAYENLSLDNKDAIFALRDMYNKMSVYQQSFIANEIVGKLEKYVERMNELLKDQEDNKDSSGGENDGGGDSDSANKTE